MQHQVKSKALPKKSKNKPKSEPVKMRITSNTNTHKVKPITARLNVVKYSIKINNQQSKIYQNASQ